MAEGNDEALRELLRRVDEVRGLSDRELQAARLARLGWSNRRIAEELGLSHRTVENHLYRAFAKLGIGGRDELAGVLDPPAGEGAPA